MSRQVSLLRLVALGLLAVFGLVAGASAAPSSEELKEIEDLIAEARRIEVKDPAAAHEIATRALTLAEVAGDEALLARAQNRLGVSFYLQADYPRAYELYSKSRKNAESAGDVGAAADAVNNLGVLHYLWGDWQEALALYSQGLEMRQRTNDRKGMAVAYNNLGNVAYAAQRFAEALDYYRQSQSLYLEIGEEHYLASSHNNVGLVHLKLGDLTKARVSFTEAQQIAARRGDRVGLAMAADHLGMADFEEGKFAAARQAIAGAIELRRELGDLTGLATSLTNLASVEAKENDGAAAERHLEEALELARKLAVPELERDALELRSRIRAEAGDLRAALEDARAFQQIETRIFSERSSRQLAATRALFELEKKDHEIEGLKKEKSFQRMIRLSLAAVILLLLFVVALLFSRNRLQERASREIEGKNRALQEAQAELQQAARAELAHLARVAGLGEMTAAVAHELNQPLAAILTNSQMAAALLERSETDTLELGEVVDDITLGARRAWELLRHLRELARKGEIKKEPVELGNLLEETVTIAGAEARLRQVALQLVRPPGTSWWVEGDRVHLQQIVLNLLQNGIDVAAAEEPEHRVLRLELAEAGDELEVFVVDQGRPASVEVFDRMFEPFFTTKEEGMGMGLAICKRLIEAMGGEMWVKRNPGRGLSIGFRLRAFHEPQVPGDGPALEDRRQAP